MENHGKAAFSIGRTAGSSTNGCKWIVGDSHCQVELLEGMVVYRWICLLDPAAWPRFLVVASDGVAWLSAEGCERLGADDDDDDDAVWWGSGF